MPDNSPDSAGRALEVRLAPSPVRISTGSSGNHHVVMGTLLYRGVGGMRGCRTCDQAEAAAPLGGARGRPAGGRSRLGGVAVRAGLAGADTTGAVPDGHGGRGHG